MSSLPPAPIPAEYADLLVKPAIAHIATLMPDGSPQVTPVWIMREGDLLVINSARGRLKDKNLRRDGRIAVLLGLDQAPEHAHQFGMGDGVGRVGLQR